MNSQLIFRSLIVVFLCCGISSSRTSAQQKVNPLDISNHSTGNTFLTDAVLLDDIPSIQSLLKRGASPNATGRCEITPLMAATFRNNDQAIQILLDAGADPLKKDCHGKNSLDLAEENNCSSEILEKLSQAAEIFSKQILEKRQKTLLDLVSKNQIEEVKKFLVTEEPPIPIDARDELGKTTLMIASANGNLDLVKLLLSRGAELKAVDKMGHTALDLAQENQRTVIVFYLQSLMSNKAGASPSDQNPSKSKVMTNKDFTNPNRSEPVKPPQEEKNQPTPQPILETPPTPVESPNTHFPVYVPPERKPVEPKSPSIFYRREKRVLVHEPYRNHGGPVQPHTRSTPGAGPKSNPKH